MQAVSDMAFLLDVLEIIKQLRLGDHVALFYKSRAEQFSAIIPYIQEGLLQNERVLYIADDNSVPLILSKLEEAGIDVDGARRSNALQVATKHETYLRHGIFEPEQMLSDLQDEVEASMKAGFTGFRASGEMSWALDLPSALSRILEYEIILQAGFHQDFLAFCQYDETRFPEHIIRGMLKAHPLVIRNGELIKTEAHPSRFAPELAAI